MLILMLILMLMLASLVRTGLKSVIMMALLMIYIKPWLPRTFRNLHHLKCYYDQILDINFFTFSNTIGVPKLPRQFSGYYE